jgi:2-methylcitrate dehydratase PrpD
MTPAAAACGVFAASTAVPEAARRAARTAWLDTIGVMLAGAVEASARKVQRVCEAEGGHPRCQVAGAATRTSAGSAALANGTAAHALDFDDMCFVSMAHPSAPLVAASLAAGELAGASGTTLLDAYVVGFEIEALLGRAVNPSHYRRGWHCTSTLGSIGAAAAAARVLSFDEEATARAISIAASCAAGLKENFGTMVKPLHAGLAARNGVLAALLAAEDFSASETALDGPQGFVPVTSDEPPPLPDTLLTLGTRWEILETGIAIKLYPSCAATHPMLDTLLDLRRKHGFSGRDVETVDVAVDPVTPTVLIHPEPRTALEAKFSLQYCAAAAAAQGLVDVGTFEDAQRADPEVTRLLPRVRMVVDDRLGRDAPSLTQARITVTLADGRRLTAEANGARGYPANPPSREDLDAKFRACGRRALEAHPVEAALEALHRLESIDDIRSFALRLAGRSASAQQQRA